MNILEYCNNEDFDQRKMDEYIEWRNKYHQKKKKLQQLRKWYELYNKNNKFIKK